MQRHAAVLLAASLACGCSDLPATLPAGPTAVAGASPAVPPAGPGTVLRIEHWSLRLVVVDMAGTACADALHATRSGGLTLEVRDNGAVAFTYEAEGGGTGSWTGWIHETGVEGSGTAYEDLPCSDTAAKARGAPSTLTGSFSPDGRRFTATELRRYFGGPSGEILYYIAWTAAR